MSNYRELEARIRALERDLSRGARTVRFGAVSNNRIEDDTDGGVNNSNGSSCDEMSCLNIPGLTDDLCKDLPLWPEYYEFELPSLDCRCTPSGAERTVKLYSTAIDNLVWESKHGDSDPEQFTCKAASYSLESSTVTAHWTWTAGNPANCYAGYSVTCREYSPGAWGWPATVTGPGGEVVGTCTSCGGPDLSAGGTCTGCTDTTGSPWINTAPPCGPGVNEGAVYTAPCKELTASPHWELTSVSPEGCSCTPAEPDFDGTDIGDTATTTCTGDCPTDCAEVDKVAFWRLTIGTGVDYYGTTTPTKLELIVGSTARLTLYLDNPHRPFCPSCVNSFRTGTCKACTKAPSIICLLPILKGGLTTCGACKDNIIPRHFLMYITLPSGRVIGPIKAVAGGTETCPLASIEFDITQADDPDLEAWGVANGYTSQFVFDLDETLGRLAVFAGFTRAEIYSIDQDVSETGCNRILTFTSHHGESEVGWIDPDGTVLTFYPIPEDPLA